MATYTRKKCPHCGVTYESYNTYTKQYSTGSPFISCKHCGKTFVDRDIKEPALKPYSDNNISVINCIFAFFMPFGALGIFLSICAYNYRPTSVILWVIACIADLIYILLTAYCVINRKKLQQENYQEYQRSLNRLQNKEYAQALKNAGFDVPLHFLKTYTSTNHQPTKAKSSNLSLSTKENSITQQVDSNSNEINVTETTWYCPKCRRGNLLSRSTCWGCDYTR